MPSYPIEIADADGVARLQGEATFTDPAVQPGLPTGWTADTNNPANVNTNGGSLDIGQGVLAGLQSQVALNVAGAGVGVTAIADNSGAGLSHLGVFARPAAGHPCFTAIGDKGATVALDAGGLLVTNCAPIQIAAGVPVGPPTGLPLAFDSTAVTGGLYVWNGAAWVKVSAIP